MSAIETKSQPPLPNPRAAQATPPNATIPLPTELRNRIYAYLLAPYPKSPCASYAESDTQFWVEPSYGPSQPGKFQLYRRSNPEHFQILAAYRALGLVSKATRREATTFFWSQNHIRVMAFRYDYLPVFLGFLNAIGPLNRAVLKRLDLYGNLNHDDMEWKMQVLQDKLISCRSLQTLELQLQLPHFCGMAPEDILLKKYMGREIPCPYLSQWTGMISAMKELARVEFKLVSHTAVVNAPNLPHRPQVVVPWLHDPDEEVHRSHYENLAKDLEGRLINRVETMNPGRQVDIQVWYDNGLRMAYMGRPWSAQPE